FVLSWSMLEAMSAGCLMIASDTAPVRDVVRADETAILVPFFAVDQLAETVVEALQTPAKFLSMREAARRYVVEHFDAARICVPRMRFVLGDGLSPPSGERRDFAGPMPASADSTAEVPSAKELLRNPFT